MVSLKVLRKWPLKLDNNCNAYTRDVIQWNVARRCTFKIHQNHTTVDRIFDHYMPFLSSNLFRVTHYWLSKNTGVLTKFPKMFWSIESEFRTSTTYVIWSLNDSSSFDKRSLGRSSRDKTTVFVVNKKRQAFYLFYLFI